MSELVELLKDVTTDLFVEFISYKQRHWHIEGIVFKDIHEMFDDATDIILEFIDTIGEYIVSFGEIAPSSLTTIVDLTKIPVNEETERDPKKLLQSALNSTKYLKDSFTEISDKADKAKQYGVTNAVQDIITKLDKLIYKYQAYLDKF